MDHIFILIRVVAYTVGIVNLVAMATIYLLFRSRTVLLSIIVIVPFTIVLIGETWWSYIHVNQLSELNALIPAVLTNCGIALLTSILPVFAHRVGDRRVGAVRMSVFVVSGTAAFVIGLGSEIGMLPASVGSLHFVLLGLSITYSAGFGLMAVRRTPRRSRSDIVRIAEKVARSMVVFLPLLVVFDFFQPAIPWVRDHIPRTVTVLPFFFVFWNVLLLLHAIRSLRSIPDGSAFSPRNAMAQFGLTGRESQVIAELVRGSSYAEIGRKLFISLATVKTHVNHIYRKTNTRSRPELMNRLRPLVRDDAQDRPSG